MRAAYLLSIILLVTMLVPQGAVCAQGSADARIRVADQYYKQMAYASAAREYNEAAKLGAVNEHVSKRLAECYMKLGDSEKAERWYAQVVKFLNREPRDLYNYAEALKSNGKYEQAEEWMDRYLAITQREGEPRRSHISDFAKKFARELDRFHVRNVSTNTPYADICPSWFGSEKVIFASSRNRTVGVARTAAWNDQPFLDLYVAVKEVTGDLVQPQRLEGDLNSKLHESSVSVSSDRRTIWFTRNNKTKSRNGVNTLGINRAQWDNGRWGQVEPFIYNSPEINLGHPSLSTDGQRLYFASDMPGGMGGTDIYVCKDVGGRWGEPENLGPTVNTRYNESFPFIAANGTLYFASNGHPGLGGLDIFAAPSTNGKFPLAINVGVPVNGPKDDFAFIIDAEGRTGFFTSSRDGGIGDDDIYSFVMNRPIEPRYLCIGFVIDDENDQPIADVEVKLLDLKGNVVDTRLTDIKGSYSFTVEKDREYRVSAGMKGRYDGEQFLSTENIEQQQIIARDIHLVPDAGIWLRGVARYKDQMGFVPGVTASLVNLSSFFTEVQTTGDGGNFSFRLQPNEQFEVLLEKPGYFNMSVPVTTVGVRQGVIDLNEATELEFEPIVVGKEMTFKHIRWQTGSSTLDPIARTEVDALAARLLVNPGLRVEIAVHCDARGDALANLKQTQARAQALVDHLKLKGVPADKLMATGHGANKLLNHCAAGVTCTEEEHAANRRTAYLVVEELR